MGLALNQKATFSNLVLVAVFLLLVIGGFGENLARVRLLGLGVSILLLVLFFFRRKKIKFPSGFIYFPVFLVFLAINIFWSGNRGETVGYLLNFISGGLFWILFYNLKNYQIIAFDKSLVILGALFTLIFIYQKYIVGRIPINSISLYMYTSSNRDHIHFGDLLSLSVLIVVKFWLVKPKVWQVFLAVTGVFFIATSFSRSSYLSLGVGLFYIFWKKGTFQKYKKTLFVVFSLVACLFIYSSFKKSLFFSRPFFFQAVLGFFQNPFGVGLGNFGSISIDYKLPGTMFRGYSGIVENILLELLVGMGIFALPFLAWIVKSLRSLSARTERDLIYSSIFIALSVNFLFDMTYYIPTMLWIWFICLGLGQKRS